LATCGKLLSKSVDFRIFVLKITLNQFFSPKKSFVWVTLAYLSLTSRDHKNLWRKLRSKMEHFLWFFFPPSDFIQCCLSHLWTPCFPLLLKQKKRERERALEVDLSRLSSFYLKPAILPPTYDQFMLPSRQQCRSFFRPATNIALSSLTHNSCSRSFTLPRLLTPAQASPPSIPGLWVLLVVMLPLIGVMLPSRKSFVSYFLELITKPHELLLHIGPPCISLKD